MAAARAYRTTPEREETPAGLEVAGDAVSGGHPAVLVLQASLAEAFDPRVVDRGRPDVKFIHPLRLAVIGVLALLAWAPVAAVAAALLA